HLAYPVRLDQVTHSLWTPMWSESQSGYRACDRPPNVLAAWDACRGDPAPLTATNGRWAGRPSRWPPGRPAQPVAAGHRTTWPTGPDGARRACANPGESHNPAGSFDPKALSIRLSSGEPGRL